MEQIFLDSLPFGVPRLGLFSSDFYFSNHADKSLRFSPSLVLPERAFNSYLDINGRVS